MDNKRLDKVSFFSAILIVVVFCNYGFANEISYKAGVKMDSIKRIVSFSEIEKPPVFADCAMVRQDCERRNCVDLKIRKVLQRNLLKILAVDNGLLEKSERVKMQFTINTKGSISNLNIEGSSVKVNRIIDSILAKLPKMNLGMHQGEIVSVFYEKNIFMGKKKSSKNNFEGKNIYFVQVSPDLGQGNDGMDIKEIVPIEFSLCKRSWRNQEKFGKCINNEIKNFVKRNFNTKLGRKLNLYGVHKVYVRFVISKCGNIIEVKARGPHPKLEEEAVRVVKLLSKYIDGPVVYNNEKINQLYQLPIVFEIENLNVK